VVEEVGVDIAELSRFTLHEVGLEGLLQFAKAIGVLPSKVILIGCKPKDFSPSLELSPEVENAIHKAVELTQATVEEFLSERYE
jgi:hydrogenase maturation protease